MDGILPLWKPKGLTSHDCVMRIRKLCKTKKVGHTGTLDPEVEGVLPICIGQATKVVPYLTDTKKTYIAQITLGFSTETEDSHGATIETKKVTNFFATDYVKSILNQFKGSITQTPPMYSAVKVNGKKLYEYAREGKVVDRPERTVLIDEIKLLSDELKQEDGCQSFSFRVVCSKGTYIRTLCVDIGKAMGYPAHMSHLIRTKTGSFDQEGSYTFNEIKQAVDEGSVKQLLSPIQKGLDHLDVYYIDSLLVQKVFNGQKLPIPEKQPKTDPFRVQFGDELIAIYQIHPSKIEQIKPVRVFHTNAESR